MTGHTLKRLFLAHGRELQVYLTRRLRDAEMAADLTQETFLRYAERGANDQPPADRAAAIVNDRAFLFRTARNLMIDHLRSSARRQTVTTPDDQLARIAEDRPDSETALGARQMLARVRHVIDGLPPRTRQIFVLNRIEGLSYAEVARRLDISESSVQKHLAKALVEIMRAVKPETR